MISILGTANAETDLIDFPQRFESQVAETPHAAAVYFEDHVVTYRQLNSLANQIARYLVDNRRVRCEQCIGLCVDKSTEAIIAMLGIFKAGAAFVPLDPEYPKERLAFMIEDAGIQDIICEDAYRDLFKPIKNCNLISASDLLDFHLEDEPNIDRSIAPSDLAYIMYTSGSTGKPKGVQIEHAALAAYCIADIDVYEVVDADRTLQFSTLNFDIAIEEIFPPLLAGGSIVIRPRERSADRNELSAIVIEYDVTAIHLATAYWHEWVDLMHVTGQRVPQSIRLMVVTGEKVSAEHYRRWKSLCDHEVLWCNAYGPTEATVSSTVFIPDATWDEDNMPIGKPLAGYSAFILNDNRQPVADAETGELYIGGPALARGYLNRNDLTEKAFVNVAVDTEVHRLYKTGDLARWLPNGDIEFGGRIDHQIKLGSYRIEPGEIEAVVNQFPGVRESLISFDEIDSKKNLIAYIAVGENELELEPLSTFVCNQLPAYMVPSRFIVMHSFPKTINGKIDRGALPDASTSRVVRTTEFAAPTTELEKQLVEIYADILNIPDIGIHDDFFALGGSSLLVTRVITRIAGNLKTEIPVRDFFANPTISSIARQIERLHSAGQQSVAGPGNQADETSQRIRETLPKIKPFFFASGRHHLFAVHYAPVSNDLSHAVVICPSVGHEYARAHRNVQQLAVMLARQGHDVLRFDYSATGNSTGTPQQITANDWLSDVDQATEVLREASMASQVSVIGIRLGATLAANAQLRNVDSLLFWDPVSSGRQFCKLLDKFHRNTLRDLNRFTIWRKSVNSDQAYGMDLPNDLRQSISSVALRPASRCPAMHEHAHELRTAVVLTDQYDVDNLPAVWNVHRTTDAIFWQRPEFTASAFSSPQSFNMIATTLREDCHA